MNFNCDLMGKVFICFFKERFRNEDVIYFLALDHYTFLIV